ncbi:unnamed protein product [Prunus armeniaca]|uniref:Uncharacterized protein n=1 Tax=Prunus armeniaca TaxID=36596 RepID=A0A6J5VB95_PRUAR|nr:unnamed protein product [Prunus armeniaca]
MSTFVHMEASLIVLKADLPKWTSMPKLQFLQIQAFKFLTVKVAEQNVKFWSLDINVIIISYKGGGEEHDSFLKVH